MTEETTAELWKLKVAKGQLTGRSSKRQQKKSTFVEHFNLKRTVFIVELKTSQSISIWNFFVNKIVFFKKYKEREKSLTEAMC